MNSLWAALKQFLCFTCVLNVFFRLFCLVWNLAALGCSLPLSALLSLSIVCTSDCVTHSGCPGVRVSVAQCVSCYQKEKLCVQPKIKELIGDFDLTDWK